MNTANKISNEQLNLENILLNLDLQELAAVLQMVGDRIGEISEEAEEETRDPREADQMAEVMDIADKVNDLAKDLYELTEQE